jgi:hypothetical protein
MRRSVSSSSRSRITRRVGLAGPRLTAKERVPVEAAGVRQAEHTGGQREFTKPRLRAASLAVLEPRLHVRPRGDTNQDVVERCWLTFEDDALAACVPDQDLRPVLRGAQSGRQHQFCAQLVEFEGQNLTKARSAVTIQNDIAAYMNASRCAHRKSFQPPEHIRPWDFAESPRRVILGVR